MKLLSVDTSTSACCLAVSFDDRLVAETMIHLERGLSSQLLSVIDDLLKRAGIKIEELDGFGVATGPGSFTSVRIGMATVTGLAAATVKPVAGFSSLEVLALNAPHCSCQVCPVIDARKDEVYAGFFHVAEYPEEVAVPRVLSPESLAETVKGPTLFIGDGAVRYRELITRNLGSAAHFPADYLHRPRPANAAVLTRRAFLAGKVSDAGSLVPLYIRASDAEIALRKKVSL